jgi:diguanylate cyclase (GGDEF)-like protein
MIFTVLTISCGVFFIVYTLMYNAMVDDIRQRAIGVSEHILDSLYAEDLADIGEDTKAGINASTHIQEILGYFQEIGNLSRLYIVKENNEGELITSMNVLPGEDSDYIPRGALESDLRQSIREGIAVMGDGIYQTDIGSVYTIFWPVMTQEHRLIGTVGMEFNASSIAASHRQSVIYSLALSGALLVLISIIAYLSMSRVTESTYKKLAYTDILTGYENRMAFEHRLRECGESALLGKNVALIICDVNNLKTVNDTIGHKAGDTYIKNTADLISLNIGKELPLYRIGGDEFASIIVDNSKDEIESIMYLLRHERRPTYKNFPFSCACGTASYIKGEDKDLKETLKRADEAMYKEKKRQKGIT